MPLTTEEQLIISRCRAGYELRQADAERRVRNLISKYQRTADALLLRSAALWLEVLDDAAARAQEKAAAALEMVEALTTVMLENAKRNLINGDQGPTVEQHTRAGLRQTTIQRLHDKGKISDDEARAADQIAEIYEAIVRGLMAKCRTLDGARVDVKGRSAALDYSKMSDWIADMHRHVYLPWVEIVTKELAPGAVQLVIDVVVDGHTLNDARRARRMSYGAAFNRLVAALDRFAEIARRCRWLSRPRRERAAGSRP